MKKPNNMKIDVQAIFISDVHLGSRGSNANDVHEMLKKYNPEYLFIVGDFIDGWLLKKRHYWKVDYTNLIRKILKLAKNGTKVVYLSGNHDEFLRHYTPLDFDTNILIRDEYIWNHYYISHGDLYDGVMNLKWLAHLGSWGYEIAIRIDRLMKRMGYKKSVSKWAKDNVKNAVKFITSFENQLVYQAKKRNCVGVICGHIHKPEDKIIDGIHYLNCGDWIENNSFIIYNEGNFKLQKYGQNKQT
jgi:UDP-2,3-diacylglucosamine pyrophosphatase LpxH